MRTSKSFCLCFNYLTAMLLVAVILLIDLLVYFCVIIYTF